MNKKDSKTEGLVHKGKGQIGFLLSQVGAHAASKFGERVKPFGITPSHVGVMRFLVQSAGLNQRELCSRLSLHPSRLVVLVDELEGKGLIERRDDPSDRRSYALHLTDKGRKLMHDLIEVAQAHAEDLCRGLTPEERSSLIAILSKIVENQGLTDGVHPGFKGPSERD